MTRLAIVGAMHEEIAALRPCLDDLRTERRAGRDFHLGRLDGHDVILVRCGIGKVAAATTTAVLLDAFDARALLFTGVAGGLGDGVRVGDIVVATTLLQHDMNAEPLFPRWEVPLTGRARFDADAALVGPRSRRPAARWPRPTRTRVGADDPRRTGRQRRPLRRRRTPRATSCARCCPTRWPSRWKAPPSRRSATTSRGRSPSCARSPTAPTTPRTATSSASSRDVAAPYSRDIVRAALRLA